MRRRLTVPVLYFTVSSIRSSFGLLPVIKANFSQEITARNLSSEVMPDQEFGETEKSWRSLLEVSIAKTRKIRGSNYVQIATVDSNGEPHCRTVVFRGFLNNMPTGHTLWNVCGEVASDDKDGSDGKSCIMKMCTDLRSKKVEENANNPMSEMVWWFPKTSEQYRIRGPLMMVGEDNDDKILSIARKELWGNLSDPARESFLDPITPGEPFHKDNNNNNKGGDDVTVPKGGRDEEGKVVPPPKNFLLMLLDPRRVDYLRLTGAQYRQIDVHDDDSKSWSQERVNP